MSNSTFRILPLASGIADEARRQAKLGVSDHTLVTVDTPNSYPCRHCLRWAQPGERVILFPYQSVPSGHPYSETGPIFVHEEPCEPYSVTDQYPADFRNGRVLRAYDSNQNMIDAVVVDGEGPESVIEKLLRKPETAFLQARSATRGCFTFRIERA